MAHLIASYRFASAGYDAANTRLIDESGLGNHLPLLAGTPDFTGSWGGKTAFKMTGAAYFGGANLLHPEVWTAISVIHPKLAGSETLNYIWGTSRAYAFSDHGHQSPTQPFEDGTSSTGQFIAHRARITDSGGSCGPDTGGLVTTSTGLNIDAWNVVTDIWNGETSQVKKQWNAAGFASGAILQHYQVGMMEEMRLGYRPTALTTTGTNHLGCLRIDIYAGDYALDDPTGYAARVAALMATPDL